MPNLISQAVYDETIAILEEKKQPDIILKRMQEWYSSQGVKLYNLYFEEDYCMKTVKLKSLTDLQEDFFRQNNCKYIHDDSLKVYCQICMGEGIPTEKKENFNYPNPGIGGFYFPRIWRCEVISEVGEIICPIIEKKYKNKGVEEVVNSGYGGYTVFTCDEGISDKIIKQIRDRLTKELKRYDKHGIVEKTDSIVNFDKLSTLRDTYGGNLYYYYKQIFKTKSLEKEKIK